MSTVSVITARSGGSTDPTERVAKTGESVVIVYQHRIFYDMLRALLRDVGDATIVGLVAATLTTQAIAKMDSTVIVLQMAGPDLLQILRAERGAAHCPERAALR